MEYRLSILTPVPSLAQQRPSVRPSDLLFDALFIVFERKSKYLHWIWPAPSSLLIYCTRLLFFKYIILLATLTRTALNIQRESAEISEIIIIIIIAAPSPSSHQNITNTLLKVVMAAAADSEDM